MLRPLTKTLSSGIEFKKKKNEGKLLKNPSVKFTHDFKEIKFSPFF